MRIDQLHEADHVLLWFARPSGSMHRDKGYFEYADFRRIEGDGEERHAWFGTTETTGKTHEWAAYRDGGRWVFGSSMSRLRLIGVMTVPADFAVQPLKPGEPAKGRTTDGTCGLSWDDSLSTEWTPAPSGRCPFEYFHVDELL